jgi:hypothetical protein
MEVDADILVCARAAIQEFSLEAAREMQNRAEAHERTGEMAGMSYWRHVAEGVRQLLSGRPD